MIVVLFRDKMSYMYMARAISCVIIGIVGWSLR